MAFCVADPQVHGVCGTAFDGEGPERVSPSLPSWPSHVWVSENVDMLTVLESSVVQAPRASDYGPR